MGAATIGVVMRELRGARVLGRLQEGGPAPSLSEPLPNGAAGPQVQAWRWSMGMGTGREQWQGA
eukprot:1004051-Rhodomonas_salina.2